MPGKRSPRIVFTKGGGLWLQDMQSLDCEVLGLDWTMNLGQARAVVGGTAGGPGKALQGNHIELVKKPFFEVPML